MTTEYLTAIASVGTFIVIAITAVAAVIQLRHIHAANQLAGAMHVAERFRSEEIQRATRFIYDDLPGKLRDPNYRAELLFSGAADRRSHPELFVADMLEQMGSYIKHGMLDSNQYLDVGGGYTASMWEHLREAIALRRAGANQSSMYENFEFSAALAEEYQRRHPNGGYPRRVPRLMPDEEWRKLSP